MIASVGLFLWDSIWAFTSYYLIDGGFLFAVFVRILATLPVQYFYQQRLFKPAQTQENLVLKESAEIASLYALIAVGTNVLSTVYIVMAGIGPSSSLYAVAEHVLGGYLAFNLFFLLVDIKSCTLMLDELHLLAECKQLTMDKFVMVRSEIHRRVRETRWACDLIIIPCVACIAIILVLFLYILDRESSRAGLYSDVGFLCFMLKELLFVVVAFVYVAEVNARADELAAKLSSGMWPANNLNLAVSNDPLCSTSNAEVGNSPAGGMAGSLDVPPHTPEAHRVSICISCMQEPISFTLLFKRVSWRNVTISAMGFIVAILIATIRSAVVADVEK
eukprot:gene22563-25564_t